MLLNQGRLFEVQRWVESGRPVRFQFGRWETDICALEMAIPTGFHSLVSWLLDNVLWSDEEKSRALEDAVWEKECSLVELLLDAGAPTSELDFAAVCDLMDADLLERLVDTGLDPTRWDGFADGLCCFTGRPLLRFYRNCRHRVTGLDEQVCIALRHSIREKKLQACVLMLWAGADPARKVPWEIRADFPGYADVSHKDFEDDPWGNAFHDLAYSGDLEFFLKLNLKPPADQISAMLEMAAFRPEGGLFDHLLSLCPPNLLNSGDRDSCAALEALVQFERFKSYNRMLTASSVFRAIEACMDYGARWNPRESDFQYIRSALVGAPHSHSTRVVELLHDRGQSPEKLWRIVRTPSVKKLFYGPTLGVWRRVRDRALDVGITDDFGTKR